MRVIQTELIILLVLNKLNKPREECLNYHQINKQRQITRVRGKSRVDSECVNDKCKPQKIEDNCL